MALSACASATADIKTEELEKVVEADAVSFDGAEIPGSFIDRVADEQVVLLGETHHLREHWELVASLLSDLYEHGFRQLLIEAPHMAGWLIDDYVQGSPLVPEWSTPSPFYERRLSLIREFNASLAGGEPIHVYGIDANEETYGGAGDFELLLQWFVKTLPTDAPVHAISTIGYANATPSEQGSAIEGALAALDADRDRLVASWGAARFAQLVDLLTIERDSIDVRVARERNDDDGARLREDLIKRLADRRIEDCACGTVINIGAHHAQQAPMMGTDQEWLGDYLAHTSTVVDGSIVVVGFSAAKTELESGAEGTPWDILQSKSPDNELLRIMAAAFPGDTVFLPLDRQLFSARTVAYNSEDTIYIARLAQQFDAIVQYGVAHRMPVN